MKLFLCQFCGQTLLFENVKCERCGHQLGYLPEQDLLSAVEPSGASWTALASPDKTYRFCANWEREGCNWMVAPDANDIFCIACRHNRTIPNISDPANHMRWQKIEAAKRRLVYTLINRCPRRRAMTANLSSSTFWQIPLNSQMDQRS